MRIGIALLIVIGVSGCVSPTHKQSFSITTRVKGTDLQDPRKTPGTAECGCTYSVNW